MSTIREVALADVSLELLAEPSATGPIDLDDPLVVLDLGHAHLVGTRDQGPREHLEQLLQPIAHAETNL